MSATNFTKDVYSYTTYGAHGPKNLTARIESLKCTFCNEEKTLDHYSKTQVTKALPNPYAPPNWNNKKKVISCKACTIGQTTKMKCMTCDKQKPLSSFAKTQRKHADRARCLSCMKKREDEDVWASDSDSDDSDMESKWSNFM
ncbi:hypothetical protein DM01DRAFT_1406036 [Hesseltinella vesiculosa]|uniref:Stc1 domain-containing protein n=1 Tax=Hesseltinella vesiculosa TaxID=101127 RepID=A0A1X2GP70_9FUNG|nr:hypothetical protein DM01DRAFT_1406036 [Hesseltinella vesiculosa]